MKKVFYIIIPLLFLAAMEGAAWLVFRSSEKPVATSVSKPVNQQEEFEPKLQEEAIPGESKEETVPASGMSSINSESFPSPSTEEVNGVTERTIHMGVRQWKWDPRVIRAKEGELVRLVIHNADVKHAIVIPALNVQQDIPPDGAIVKFKATKKGTFEFLCATYCGVGHAEMQGKIIVE